MTNTRSLHTEFDEQHPNDKEQYYPQRSEIDYALYGAEPPAPASRAEKPVDLPQIPWDIALGASLRQAGYSPEVIEAAINAARKELEDYRDKEEIDAHERNSLKVEEMFKSQEAQQDLSQQIESALKSPESDEHGVDAYFHKLNEKQGIRISIETIGRVLDARGMSFPRNPINIFRTANLTALISNALLRFSEYYKLAHIPEIYGFGIAQYDDDGVLVESCYVDFNEVKNASEAVNKLAQMVMELHKKYKKGHLRTFSVVEKLKKGQLFNNIDETVSTILGVIPDQEKNSWDRNRILKTYLIAVQKYITDLNNLLPNWVNGDKLGSTLTSNFKFENGELTFDLREMDYALYKPVFSTKSIQEFRDLKESLVNFESRPKGVLVKNLRTGLKYAEVSDFKFNTLSGGNWGLDASINPKDIQFMLENLHLSKIIELLDGKDSVEARQKVREITGLSGILSLINELISKL